MNCSLFTVHVRGPEWVAVAGLRLKISGLKQSVAVAVTDESEVVK
jgi:hypothetical protein